MVGIRGSNSRSKKEHRVETPSSALAAQAAAVMFNKSNTNSANTNNNSENGIVRSRVVSSSGLSYNSQAQSSPHLKKTAQRPKTASVAETRRPERSEKSEKSERMALKRRTSSYATTDSNTDTTMNANTSTSTISGLNSSFTADDTQKLSMTALSAAALAAKKISSSVNSPINQHSNLSGTGFLQPPEKSNPAPVSPQLSSRSGVSSNSEVLYSPGGLTVSKDYNGNNNSNNNNNRSVSVEKPIRINARHNNSSTDLLRPRASIGNISTSSNLSYGRRNNTQESFGGVNNSPIQITDLQNMSQLSLSHTNQKSSFDYSSLQDKNKSKTDFNDFSMPLRPPLKNRHSSVEHSNMVDLSPQVSGTSKSSLVSSGSVASKHLKQKKKDYRREEECNFPIESRIIDQEDYLSDYTSDNLSEDAEFPRYPEPSSPVKSKKSKIKKRSRHILRDLGFKGANGGDRSMVYQINHSQTQNSITNFGQKPVEFRKTMRKTKKKHKDFNEDKPWKNHNDAIVVTEAEKKRYEGLWVANRGLYINLMKRPINKGNRMNTEENQEGILRDSYNAVNAVSSSLTQDINDPSQLIHGYVVRNLWRRSNLPDDILAKIWNLVDLRKDGTLNRDEFVVGTWLVDQCLYGRKLPKTVDENVWASVKKLVFQVVVKPKKNKLLK